MFMANVSRKNHQHEVMLAEKWHLEEFYAIVVCEDSGLVNWKLESYL